MIFLISGLGLAYVFIGYKFAKKVFDHAEIDDQDDPFEIGITFVGIGICWPLFTLLSMMYGVFAEIGKRLKKHER